MCKDCIAISLRPELGETYISTDGASVEVLAVSSSHVVCDHERIYTRDDFERFFMSQSPINKASNN